MSLIMDQNDMYEAYGPNGPDADDIQTWNIAVERSCGHDEAQSLMEANGMARCYCPTCGTQVEYEDPDDVCPYAEAEARAFGYGA